MKIAKKDAALLLAELDLGSSVAETDTLLEAARVETSVFDDLLSDRVDLIPGTKGSGKTALYRMFVDFLPEFMLQGRKVVIAHGVRQRQDTVFLAYKKEFDKLTESDFIDFWCIYFISLAYEHFIKNEVYRSYLEGCESEIKHFQGAYRRARIPDFEGSKSLKEIISWALALVQKLKPTVTWKAPDDAGQLELSLGLDGEKDRDKKTATVDDPRMPSYIDLLAASLENLLAKVDLNLWLMVDRLDELFARRSETERRALRGLLKTIRLFRSDRIRIKIFLRDDIFEHLVSGEGFAAFTHVTARQSDTLRWSEDQILTMIVNRIFSNEAFRQFFRVDSHLLKDNPEYRSHLFYKVFSDTVHRPPNQSPTLRWIYNHTKDGRGVVTPRDVIDLLTRASQKQRDTFRHDSSGETDRLIYGPAIVYGLDELSKGKRVNYLEAEFPHKWEVIRKLLGGGTEYSQSAARRLFGSSLERILEDLISMGVLYRASRKGEPTFRIPFVCRKGLECTQKYIAK